ncbi:MAG: PD-(D/E)XK nuclease family protein [Planctomycetes bacterium]|nr:PD-(D/E)XK nuclease family protein [Planctomycetota bacterium]
MSEKLSEHIDAICSRLEGCMTIPGVKSRDVRDILSVLSENWMSDQLAWLMDTHGSHGYRTQFAKRFLQGVATKRDNGYCENEDYFLSNKVKTRQPGPLNLDNACVVREYYLSPSLQCEDGRGACDIVFADLDENVQKNENRILMAIENKLFSRNHNGQLEHYSFALDSKYRNITIRERVYLTFTGEEPRNFSPEQMPHKWVCMSWIYDILPILEELGCEPGTRAKDLLKLLAWMKNIYTALSNTELTNDLCLFRHAYMQACLKCVLSDLRQIRELDDLRGRQWSSPKEHMEIMGKKSKKPSAIIRHSGHPKKFVKLSFRHNLNIIVSTIRNKKNKAEKILVPFGINAEQVMNFLRITAMDLYKIFNGEKEISFDSGNSQYEEWGNLFKFSHKHRCELIVLSQLQRHMTQNPDDSSDEELESEEGQVEN